jgi:endoglucanase
MNDSYAANVTGRRLELLHLGANNGSAPAGLSNGSAPAGLSNGSAPAGLSNDSVPAGLSNGSFGADGQPAGLNSSGIRRLPAWLSNGSFLADGEAVGLNLAGGYFDAGDYIKSTKTISHAMTLLAWALLEFRAGASHGL